MLLRTCSLPPKSALAVTIGSGAQRKRTLRGWPLTGCASTQICHQPCQRSSGTSSSMPLLLVSALSLSGTARLVGRSEATTALKHHHHYHHSRHMSGVHHTLCR